VNGCFALSDLFIRNVASASGAAVMRGLFSADQMEAESLCDRRRGMNSSEQIQRQNRVLVAANLALAAIVGWTLLGDRAPAVATASAEVQEDPQGIPNAGGQRQKMIEELRLLRQSVDTMHKSITGGKLKVEVSNIDKLKTTEAPAAEKPAPKVAPSK
jgi:hypothetical protein